MSDWVSEWSLFNTTWAPVQHYIMARTSYISMRWWWWCPFFTRLLGFFWVKSLNRSYMSLYSDIFSWILRKLFLILRVNTRCAAVKQVTFFFLPKSWSKPLSTTLEANTLTIAQSKWFDQINKTDEFPFYAVFTVVKLGDNCIVFENFTASIGDLMGVNWAYWRREIFKYNTVISILM